jgi:hypothetical protein
LWELRFLAKVKLKNTTAKTLKIVWKKQEVTIEPDEIKEVDEEFLQDKDTKRLLNFRLLEMV